MKPDRLRLSLFLLLVLFSVLLPVPSYAQRYPERSVRVVVPFSPGGGTDNIIRVMAPRMAEAMGQQFVVDNRPGANAQIGPAIVAQAATDGYTLLAADQSFASNPALYPNLPYDTLKDFVPISTLATGAVVLVMHPSVPARTLKEVLALMRSRPGQVTFATGGVGTGTHLGMELFKGVAKVDLVHVPYKGGGAATAAVVGGEVVTMFAGPSSAATFVKVGKLRAVAITGTKRNASMPEVATFEELGLPGVDAGTIWYTLARTGTSPDIVNALSAAMAKVLRIPEVRNRLVDLGYEPMGTTAEEAAKILRADVEKWTRVVREKKIRPE
jgi:tripartite-type tricarboxylate transporter receptor subunit TctC